MAIRNQRRRSLWKNYEPVRLYSQPPRHIVYSQGAAFTDSIYRISNIILAMPGAEWQKAAAYGVDFEKKALMGSSDRVCPT